MPDEIRRRPGRPLLLAERCGSCIFGDNSPVAPGRVREVIRGNLAEGTLLMCHSTLYGQTDEEAMCRGFWDAHRDRVNVTRVMNRLAALSGGGPWWEEVPPPAHTEAGH
jgi:hypothetical protein